MKKLIYVLSVIIIISAVHTNSIINSITLMAALAVGVMLIIAADELELEISPIIQD